MRLLDMFSGAGGAAMGYSRAGFSHVVGIDITYQPNYPFTFWRGDALALLDALLDGSTIGLPGQQQLGLGDFDLIHASPPCQLFSAGNRGRVNNPHPDLIDATRERLERTGLPYVIENVPGAPLIDPIEICGRMFPITTEDFDGETLWLDRHRLFESNWEITPMPDCRPHDRTLQVAGCYGGARRDKWDARNIRRGGYVPDFPVLQRLMGIDWATEREMYLAIPPAYSEYIGKQFL